MSSHINDGASKRERIVTLLKAGMASKEIAFEVGCVVREVYRVRWLSKKNKPTANQRRELTKARNEQIAAMRQAGMSTAEISGKVNLDPSGVRKIVRELGLERERRSRPRVDPDRIDATIAELHELGMVTEAISRRVGLRRSEINQRLDALGLKRHRPPGMDNAGRHRVSGDLVSRPDILDPSYEQAMRMANAKANGSWW